MLQLFNQNSGPILGLDISSTSVKSVLLSREADQYCVEGFGVMPMPAGSVVEKLIKKPDAISKAVSQLIKSSHFNTDHAAVAVSDSSAIIKTVQLDAGLDEDDIENLFLSESSKFIPFPISEVSLDFNILGPVRDKADLVEVLLVATRTENIDERVAAAGEGGVDVKVVEVESHAIERACTLLKKQLPNEGKDKTIAVIDIGASMITVSILRDLKTIFTRDEVFGGDQLTKTIQKTYALSYAEAGLAKKKGGLPEDYEAEVLKPFVESVILQIRRAFQMFFSASAMTLIDHIVLMGGTANIRGLDAAVQEEMGINTTIADPFVDMIVAPQIDADRLRIEAPALMTACGLALRNFDREFERDTY